MKRLIPALIFSAFVLTGCLEGSSNYTPTIATSYFISSTGDTLSGSYNSTDGSYDMDTMYVGDTIQFAIAFNAYTNSLIYTKVGWDSTYVKLWSEVDDDFMKALTKESVFDDLLLYYVDNCSYSIFPVYFIPIKEGNSKLSFTVNSNAEKVGNTSNATLNLRVVNH